MTTLKRTFDLETRTLKSKDRCYVGQVYDHISTTLEFTYNPMNALTDGMYTAYIMFDLYDDAGNIFVFGPGSAPRFDGRTFEIPTSVTSRITTQRLDYQIWLIKNRTEWNGRIEELGDTEYLFSAKDSLAFKPTTRCRSPSRDPCRPPQPCLEPGTLGWVNYLRDHCILTPIQESYGTLEDGTEGVTLLFPTYNQDRDQTLELHIPYLDAEGLIDIHTFLRVVEEYNPDVTHDQIMTALCVQNLLDEKLDKSSVIDSWKAISEGGIETPSAELAYKTFETKADKDFPIPLWNPDIHYARSAVVTWEADIYISNVDNNFNCQPDLFNEVWSAVTEFDTVIDSYDIPWAEYKDSLRSYSARLLRRNPIGPWDPTVEYQEDSLVIHDGVVFISQGNPNIGHVPVIWTQDQAKISSCGCPYEDMSWWAPIRGAGEKDIDVSTFTEIIGPNEYRGRDGPTGRYAYEVKHNFNTSNIFVQSRTNNMSDPTVRSYFVDALYDVTDRNSVMVLLNEPLTDNELIVSVTPGGGIEGEYAKRSYQALYEKDQPSGYLGLDNAGMVPMTRLYLSNSLDPSTGDYLLATMAVARELDRKKTDKTEFGEWNPDRRYHEGSVVSYDYQLYISVQEVNEGKIPTLEPKFWHALTRDMSAYIIPRRTILFGNATDTEYILTHDMDTMNFMFSVRRNDYYHEYLYPRVFAVDMDTVKIIVDEAPGDNGLILNLMDCTMKKDVEDVTVAIVDTPSETWTFDNQSGYPMLVWVYDKDGDDLSADIIQKDATGFDPIVINIGSEMVGSVVMARAQRMFTLDKPVLEIDLEKEGLDPTKLYLVQVYAEGSEGQAVTEIIQNVGGGKIIIRTNDADNNGVADLEGYVILREAAMHKVFTVEDEEVRINHNLGRPVGIQVFQSNGEVAGTIMSCNNDDAWAYTAGYGGYMVIL